MDEDEEEEEEEEVEKKEEEEEEEKEVNCGNKVLDLFLRVSGYLMSIRVRL
ncbi:hypothetical protein E2C01_087960 [Portunus trituberculatus]|uniref:Uncharacterized protein n=1 Tax=Portunus trituberculatus TaxID=210409 RepID=A0A5B7JD80_PORTR|nr:hypothetical protein [Portunus trituberculatus]